MNRRSFLSAATAAAGSYWTTKLLARLTPPETPSPVPPLTTEPGTLRGEMLYRPLGRTGVTVSAIGMGGAHLGGLGSDAAAVRLVRSAVDRGLTFMDNSWDYSGGRAEERMGKALAGGWREKVFLMTKVDGRTKASAQKQLDESLRRLKTDRLDLWQFHEVIRAEDPDRIFARGGALEAALEARTAGKVRFVGFTGHKDPSIHLKTLAAAKAHGFTFDTVQMPLNVMDAHFRSFAHAVVPVALEAGTAVLGMKSMGDRFILKSGTVSAPECLRYALSLPTSVVITGIDSEKVLDQAFAVAKAFRPMGRDEVAALLARTRKAAAKGEFELFKTSAHFDATAHHPEWLG